MAKCMTPIVALALSLCLAACETRTGPRVLKISNGVNEQHPTCLACRRFEEIVEAKLPGRYDVQVFANAQLGDDVRATESVRMGTLEMVATSASPLTGLAPELNVFDLPFIVPNERAADCVCDGPVGAKLAVALEAKGIKLLAYYENGFRQLTNSVREVRSPSAKSSRLSSRRRSTARRIPFPRSGFLSFTKCRNTSL
jgi:TRAP-type C4-dicarboxylate transport system substrate-binding protein